MKTISEVANAPMATQKRIAAAVIGRSVRASPSTTAAREFAAGRDPALYGRFLDELVAS